MRKRIFEFASPEAFIAKRAVKPGPNQAPFRCGKCGESNFGVMVDLPKLAGGPDARVRDLVCLYCSTVYKLNNDGQVEGVNCRDAREIRNATIK